MGTFDCCFNILILILMRVNSNAKNGKAREEARIHNKTKKKKIVCTLINVHHAINLIETSWRSITLR